MKFLQAVVAVLTVLLFMARQNVFCGVYPAKRLPSDYCPANISSGSLQLRGVTCARAGACDDDMEMPCPKYKRDPKISVDNEDIDYRPLE